jgi:Fe-S-cluster-containing dehydrogenase component/DMSO reductase anchor subunit
MTASLDTIELPAVPGTSETVASPKRRLPVLPVNALLQAQQTLTAVERFAKKHDTGGVPAQEKYYRDLIPLERPRAGQQYAFQVDLDACTGCKACVSACHTLNGLDENELWRTVGLLHGGSAEEPALQTVTTSCHHCIDPACLKGCPTLAYEKDPITGIVKHLDDQCFGCEYCTLMCPYDAPKYSKARGIVRKCDMCSVRLEHGEAPACVQACPNQAISIQVVEKAEVVVACDAQSFVAGAAAPERTLPTTVYKTKKVKPSNMLPADFYRTKPEHSHPPLVVMLVLTQLSVGAFIVGFVVERLSGHALGSPVAQTAIATALSIVALAASVLHLGRPLLAWRAILGIRTSWLSREAVAFGTFALLAVGYGITATPMLARHVPGGWSVGAAAPALQDAASAAGALGIFCSMMVYVATRREQWSGVQTGLKFLGSTVLLGAATVVSVGAATSPQSESFDGVAKLLLMAVQGATLLKLSADAAVLFHSRDSRQSTFKRMACVMLGDLRTATNFRWALALAGGVVLPLVVWWLREGAEARVVTPIMMVVLLTAGELVERYLFFRAAPALRMPGGIR